MKKILMLLLLAITVLAIQAGATVVTSIPGGTVIPMPIMNYFGGGPIAFGPGVTWSSTNASTQGGSVFGYTDGYGFGSNGFWDSAYSMAGVNDAFSVYGVTDTMTFALSTPVSAIGGFLNYYPDGDTTPTTIAVYDSSCDPRSSACTPIESFNLTFFTDGSTDSGFFYGFQETSANISYFTLSDNYVGITNLTIATSVPEPGSLLLLGSGLLGIVSYGRRRLGL